MVFLVERKADNPPRDSFAEYLAGDVYEASINIVTSLTSAPATRWEIDHSIGRVDRLRSRALLGLPTGLDVNDVDQAVQRYLSAYAEFLGSIIKPLLAIRSDAHSLCLELDAQEAAERRVRKEESNAILARMKGDEQLRLQAYDIVVDEGDAEEMRMQKRREARQREFVDQLSLIVPGAPPLLPDMVRRGSDCLRNWVDAERGEIQAECLRLMEL
jgi:hypothetical protein